MIKYFFIFIICLCLLIIDETYNLDNEVDEYCTCFAHLGCINYTAQWYRGSCRKVNLKPQPRHVVNTKFLYLSPCSEDSVIIYDLITFNPDSVNVTKYNPYNKVIILIHDFTSSGYTGWIKHITLVLFKQGEFNVIAVDWQSGAEPPFAQAISNARLVSLECIALIRMLQANFQLRLNTIHIIGHGVGAHIAGYIGKEFKSEIGRITALDPTGPLFDCLTCIGRLCYTDALYVEVLHTDGSGYYGQGTLLAMGHNDYYFNDGHDQPGCGINKDYKPLTKLKQCELAKGKVLPGCSHKRAFKYFIESLTSSQCQFIGFKANTFSDFLQTGKIDCNTQCVSLGLFAAKSAQKHERLKLYLETQERPPFCMNAYMVTINMGCSEQVETKLTGHFELYMLEEGTNMQINATVNKYHHRTITHGKNETFIAYSNSYGVDRISYLKIKWVHTPRPFCLGCKNDAFIHNLTITHIKSELSEYSDINNEFCGLNLNGTILKNGCPVMFIKCSSREQYII